ncbi:hypothetical protein P3T27_006503 [Kitasatospora sp. MAA19]|uniref:hypothetical protein n=1 Tax=Kitasatospora sp. MAA19 TaxID=3035090 RepID=UPI0024764402|nr:hypothetical protein [Kitasatospora sp. MAA19]MDH6709754.1 hypothetical protein [Kitasatospora sp. MAA19]
MTDIDPTPTPAPEPPATEPPQAPDAPTSEPKDWQAEAEKWKKLSRENETRAKANADAAKRLAELEDAQKSEAERLAERLAASEDRASAATRLAVAARVEAMATGRFADPQDAVDALGGDFLDDAGQIDAAAIEQALTDLLGRKPHWAAPGPPGPRTPAPDPAQGARPNSTPTLAQQIADAESRGDIKASIALKSRQLRELQTNRK